jgi:SAM-dependent methyltransferase
MPAEEFEAFRDVFVRRGCGDTANDPYEIMWRTDRSARATFAIAAPITAAWLEWCLHVGTIEGRLLEIGCGLGVTSSFLAAELPGSLVVGTDRSALGVARATEIAATVGVENVRFLQAALEDITPATVGGHVDAVYGATVLVEAEPLLETRLADPWSHHRCVEAALAAGTVPATERIAAVLHADGAYFGIERQPDPVRCARWIGALAAAGLGVDTEASAYLSIGTESLPAVAARKGRPTDTADVMAWLERAYPGDLQAERSLLDDPPVECVAGSAVQVEDEDGPGETRLQVLRLDSGRLVTYTTTSRGYRFLEPVYRPASILDDLAAVVDQYRDAPSVVRVDDFTEPPTI